MAAGRSRTPHGYSRPPQPNSGPADASEVAAEFLVGQQSAATVITAAYLGDRPSYADTTTQVSPRVLKPPYPFSRFVIFHCPPSHFQSMSYYGVRRYKL
ncbi:unnamed protein product [Echinostoma caproni]|uniref:Uncharacterized protein n=1 Tax=Echinostoma caproni TaxID=27848 RepID=A0A183BC65_9TREM|nr:unnamed protein product [Echinostoma caproni]